MAVKGLARGALALPELNDEHLDDTDIIEDPSESESEPESESGSESDDDEEVKATEPSKTAKYNAEGILDKLADIKWPENVDWVHKLSVDVDRGEEAVDVNDDLARELAFYNQALSGTRIAFERLQSAGAPFLRPADYYAEMAKTDAHMEKVKGRLLAEKRRLEEAEERRKARESRRLSKEVQAQKQKERAKEKKDSIESVKKWMKERKRSGFAKDEGGGDGEFAFEDGKSFERKPGGGGPADRSGGRGKDKKRRAAFGEKPKMPRKKRDQKFGFGGRKGMSKQNTAASTNDIRPRSFGGNNKKRKTSNF